jgi:hypothetical protein
MLRQFNNLLGYLSVLAAVTSVTQTKGIRP